MGPLTQLPLGGDGRGSQLLRAIVSTTCSSLLRSRCRRACSSFSRAVRICRGGWGVNGLARAPCSRGTSAQKLGGCPVSVSHGLDQWGPWGQGEVPPLRFPAEGPGLSLDPGILVWRRSPPGHLSTSSPESQPLTGLSLCQPLELVPSAQHLVGPSGWAWPAGAQTPPLTVCSVPPSAAISPAQGPTATPASLHPDAQRSPGRTARLPSTLPGQPRVGRLQCPTCRSLGLLRARSSVHGPSLAQSQGSGLPSGAASSNQGHRSCSQLLPLRPGWEPKTLLLSDLPH